MLVDLRDFFSDLGSGGIKKKNKNNIKCNKNKMENMLYATVTKISMKYLVVCNVYTEEGGIKLLSHIGLGRAAPV